MFLSNATNNLINFINLPYIDPCFEYETSIIDFTKPYLNIFVNFTSNINIVSVNFIYFCQNLIYTAIFICIFNVLFSNHLVVLKFYFNNYVFYFFTVLEKEIMSFPLLKKLFVVFILFISAYNFSFLFYEIFPIAFLLNFYFLLLLIFCVTLIPINLIYSYGAYFLAYIRGSSLKKNLFFESLIDCLNLISYFIRINIQFIRIILISVMFFLYEDSYYEVIYPWYNKNIISGECVSFTDYIDFSLTYFVTYFFLFLYELAHFWSIFFMQATVFSLLLVLLIQFLYTLYIVKHIQLFFKNKR